MTYLQIVRRLARACGMTASANIPATVAGQTGNLLDAVDWANDAYNELQTSQDWRWLRSQFTVNTTSGVDAYAYGACTDSRLSATISRFSKWFANDNLTPPKCYLTSGGVGGQYFLKFIDWESFCSLYRIGNINPSSPCHITVDPQDRLVLGPTPNDVYTITGDYQMGPQVLSVDDDTPEMPSKFHMLIAYDAMRKYAGDQAAQEAMTRAVNEGGHLRSILDLEQLPMWRSGRPMA